MWTPARAPVPQRAPWSALTATGFYVNQGRAGGLSSSCRLMRARSHSLGASAWAATGYPVTWDAIGRILSRAMNVCAPGVRAGGGDENRRVFECSALQHIRDEYPALFSGHHTMQSLMNQANQKSIIHFIFECLDCSNHLVGAEYVAILRWASGTGSSWYTN